MRSFIEGHLGQNATLGIQRNSARAVEAFNSWAHSIGRRDDRLEGMACTLTALVFRGRRVHVIHVGDTRAYRWREERLDQMTTDHALGGAGLRHILTRAVGAEESIRIDYATDTLRLYDRYLLCSDGIHGGVTDRALAEILARRNAPEQTARELVEAGIAARTGDNATALVVDVIGPPPADTPTSPSRPRACRAAGAESQCHHRRLPLAGDACGRPLHRVFDAEDRSSGGASSEVPKPATSVEDVLRGAFLREAWIAARIRSPWSARPSSCRRTGPGSTRQCRSTRAKRRTAAVGPPGLSLTAPDYAIKSPGASPRFTAPASSIGIKPDNVTWKRSATAAFPGCG